MLPFRELGHSDDFAYHHTVRNFVATGDLKITDWSATSLIVQVFWGALFSYFFGFSYKTLHLATVVFLYIGIIYFYFLSKELGFGERKSVILSLALLAFPTVLRFAFSFMSVIYYLTLMIVALYYSVKAIKSNSLLFISLASLSGMITFLERQLGILIPLSLFLVIAVKSLNQRRLLFKQMLAVLIPLILIFLGYIVWQQNGNLTLEQNRYVTNITRTLKFAIPISIRRLHVTTQIYDEVVYRLGYIFHFITVILTPFVFLYFFKDFIVRGSILRKTKNFLIGAVFLGLFYTWHATRLKDININELYIFTPPHIFTIIYFDWRMVWNILTILSFPVWAFLIGLAITKIYSLFFIKRKGYAKKMFILSALIVTIITAYYLHKGYATYRAEFFDYDYVFLVFVWIFAIFLVFHLSFFKFKKRLKSHKQVYVVLFFLIFFISQILSSSLGMYFWDEYIIPFIPIVLIGLGALSLHRAIYFWLLFVAVLIFLLFSIQQAKYDYDYSGVIWEESIKAVDMHLVEPLEVSISNFAWIPYFYYEPSFNEKVKENNGDKFKITQSHTWWTNDKYAWKETKFYYKINRCSYKEVDNFLYVKEVSVKSIFLSRNYCFYINKIR